MMKYTIGFLNCEIDIEVSNTEELKVYTEDNRILYIIDENGNEVFVDKARTIKAIFEI